MVKEIILSNKSISLVDNKCYKRLNKYNWFTGNKYVQTKIKVNNKILNIYMHRLIMNAPKGVQVDHIDGNKLNNQKSNLRLVTNGQNQMNSKNTKGSSSKYKGVTWDKNRNKWTVHICLDWKIKHLGRFEKEIDAVKAYNEVAKELFGEFANLNEV